MTELAERVEAAGGDRAELERYHGVIYPTPRQTWAHERNSDWTEGREIAHREANGFARMQIALTRKAALRARKD